MSNDAFVACWIGIFIGTIFGIVLSAIFVAISNSIERYKTIPVQKAIRILKDELHHTRCHMDYKGKAPEFYQEMKEYCEALELSIKALEEKT